jgi:hypothetical protein
LIFFFCSAWAPIFCFAGSANGVPKEYCGLEPPALQRFTTHRAARISYFRDSGGESNNCTDPTAGFNSSDLSFAVHSALECTTNSYNIGNDESYWQSLWDDAGKCVAEKIGLTPKRYFWLLTHTFKRYNVDSVLKQAGYDFAKLKEVNATKVLDILQDSFGYRGAYTCDSGSRTKWSTIRFCLSALPPYRMTHCPARVLEPPSRCPTTLLIDTERGVPVSLSTAASLLVGKSFLKTIQTLLAQIFPSCRSLISVFPTTHLHCLSLQFKVY